ncbi:hypothetical protein WR164_05790 [Philodulcilactobacillus myokoensis]|uniref:Prepilin type IV endopeptidase peptidase domain-containing protein n=2 Tax=Philodulcilactobacillus myokoensis TaxID=2929573 RepID=A0A9W6B0C8_9LACO|nr:hypothetical protein WR164_05790 [Philodulcilactobacillus myokoensis]
MGCICLQFSLNVNSIFTILFEWILLLISLFDVQKMIIPTKLIHLLLIIVVIQQLINFDFNLIKFSLVLLSYTIISGINQRYSWIGNGDIDIIWIILLKTNLNMSIISLFISSCLVIIFQIASKYDKKRPIPYAPFLFAAFIITNTFVKI